MPSEETLLARIDALEIETAAYSVIFTALARVHGSEFLELAASIAELAGRHPPAGGEIGKRATEALRIIDSIRAGSDGHPKPQGIV